MNRNESFEAERTETLSIRLAWASLEILSDDVESIQVIASGSEKDVNDLKIALTPDGKLQVEQASYTSMTMKLSAERWMQVFIRVPLSWKGTVDAGTINGPLNARSLSGADLLLDTVSGSLKAYHLQSINTNLKSVSGLILAEDVKGEKLTLRSVSGDVHLTDAAFRSYKVSMISGHCDLSMTEPFDRLDGSTVSGNISLTAPIGRADAFLHSVSGRILTEAVCIAEEKDLPRISLNSVSGDLSIVNRAWSESQPVRE